MVWAVAFSPDGNQMASGSMDTTVRVWDARTGAGNLTPLEGREGPIWALAFSPDGKCIAACSGDNAVCIWDATTGAAILRLLRKDNPEGPTGQFRSIAFSLDATRIVSNSRDRFYTWDATTGDQLSINTTDHPFGELCDANHPIIIMRDHWVVDLRTQRVLSNIPEVVGVRCATGSRTSIALVTTGGLCVMHFPSTMLS